ncbi:MAG: hypothetical protein ACXV3S_01335 [Kineosporiaceae bacterium]
MADDDGALIIGAILGFVAIAAVGYAGGLSSSSTHTSTTSAPHSSSPSTSSSPSSSATVSATPAAPTCTRVVSVKSSSGASYTQYPTSSAGSSHCYLQQGNTGMPVATLQRGMALCMGHPLVADGIYGPLTANAVASVGQTGPVYGPVTAGRMCWPWFSSTTTKFNGHCARL